MLFLYVQKTTWSIEEQFDSKQGLTVASAILAAFLGSNPGISIAPLQNVIEFTL